MKKRCTNNMCRKNFTVKPDTICCPFCGKKYPRLKCHENKRNKENIMPNFAECLSNLSAESLELLKSIAATNVKRKEPKGVYISNFDDNEKINLLKTVRRWTGKGLKESKDLIESVPVFIEAKDISFNYLNSAMNELGGKLMTPFGNPIEGFTSELATFGCQYKVVFKS